MERPEQRKIFIVAIALTLLSFTLHAFVLFRDSSPFGLDGYYYAVQLRSLLASGKLYYPGMPLAFWLLAPFAALTDPIVGTKLGAAVLIALAAPATVLFVHAITQSVSYAALGGVIVAASAETLMLSGEFVKQGVGLTLVLWLLAVLARAHQRRDWIVAGVLFLACLTTHGTSAILAAWFAAPVILARLRGVARLALLAGIALAAAAVLYRYRLLITSLSSAPTAMIEAPLSLRFAALSVVLLVTAAFVRRAEGLKWVPLLVGPATFAIAANLPWIDHTEALGLGPRLQLIGFVPLALCLLVAIHRLFRRAWIAVLVIVVLLPVEVRAFRQQAKIHYQLSEILEELLTQLHGRIPEGSILIAQEHTTAFASKWFTNIETVSVEPRTIDPSRTYRLLWVGIPPRIKKQLVASRNPRTIQIGTGHASVVVVPEPDWRTFVATLPRDQRTQVDPWPSRQGE